MNLKADAFCSFLKKNNIKDFQVKELSDDEQNTPIFSIMCFTLLYIQIQFNRAMI